MTPSKKEDMRLLGQELDIAKVFGKETLSVQEVKKLRKILGKDSIQKEENWRGCGHCGFSHKGGEVCKDKPKEEEMENICGAGSCRCSSCNGECLGCSDCHNEEVCGNQKEEDWEG